MTFIEILIGSYKVKEVQGNLS